MKQVNAAAGTGTGNGADNGIFTAPRGGIGVDQYGTPYYLRQAEVLEDTEAQANYLKYKQEYNFNPKLPSRWGAPAVPSSFKWEDSKGAVIEEHVKYWKPTDITEVTNIRDNAATLGEYAFWDTVLKSIKL